MKNTDRRRGDDGANLDFLRLTCLPSVGITANMALAPALVCGEAAAQQQVHASRRHRGGRHHIGPGQHGEAAVAPGDGQHVRSVACWRRVLRCSHLLRGSQSISIQLCAMARGATKRSSSPVFSASAPAVQGSTHTNGLPASVQTTQRLNAAEARTRITPPSAGGAQIAGIQAVVLQVQVDFRCQQIESVERPQCPGDVVVSRGGVGDDRRARFAGVGIGQREIRMKPERIRHAFPVEIDHARLMRSVASSSVNSSSTRKSARELRPQVVTGRKTQFQPCRLCYRRAGNRPRQVAREAVLLHLAGAAARTPIDRSANALATETARECRRARSSPDGKGRFIQTQQLAIAYAKRTCQGTPRRRHYDRTAVRPSRSSIHSGATPSLV